MNKQCYGWVVSAVSGKASEAANEAARKTVNDAVSDVDTDTAMNPRLEM